MLVTVFHASSRFAFLVRQTFRRTLEDRVSVCVQVWLSYPIEWLHYGFHRMRARCGALRNTHPLGVEGGVLAVHPSSLNPKLTSEIQQRTRYHPKSVGVA